DQVELSFTQEAIEAAAEQALQHKTGARALRSIIEDTLMNIMYEIPSRPDIQKCVVGADTINKRTPPLLLTRSNTSTPVGLDGQQVEESSA
ncbi:MAG: ATP-dependent Clp protease ATP-binding subunit ClpX, partial [Dehalococcoidia bacterium]|nr:ATP-dependent Clp protease ATP-binding subunit ClpX [Dehalococcoidia bacterium]